MNDKNVYSADELLAQATCAICEKKDGEYGNVATAWLASDDGHLITAGHTFTDGYYKKKIGDKILVKFPDEETHFEATLKKVMYEIENFIDFAILKLSSPTKRKPLRFILVKQAQGEFMLRGYGENLPYSQSIGKGEILGNYLRLQSSKNNSFQLLCPELAYTGFSGGAVYSTQLDAVIAIQTEAIKKSRTVFAMPLYRIKKYWPKLESYASLYRTCFVIAPKNRLNKLAYEIIQPIVAEELGYEVKVSESNNSNLNLGQIEQAELIIADVTDNHPNVIYELAVGHGAGIPDIILGEETAGSNYNTMPFNVLSININDIEESKKKLRKKIKSLKSIIEELKNTPTNLITKFLHAPLTQISPAHGLALGHFYNFVKQVGDALVKAMDDTSIRIVVDNNEITGKQRENILLTIVTPKQLEWANHEFINNNVRNLTVSVSVSLSGRPRPFTLWALKSNEDGFIQLVDIFPTTMGVIAKSIDQRLNITDPSQRDSIVWREIEDKEINRFSGSLLNLINTDANLAKVVKVKSWETVFPEICDIS